MIQAKLEQSLGDDAAFLDKEDDISVKLFTSTDYKQINQQVLSYLPDLTLLDEVAFKVNRFLCSREVYCFSTLFIGSYLECVRKTKTKR